MNDDNKQQPFFLVDDHASFLDGLRISLKRAYPNADIFTAQTAQEARKTLQNLDPELIVADLSLPETADHNAYPETGIKLLRALLNAYPDYNFVIQSANVKPLIRIKPSIDAHKGGFTIVDKRESTEKMLQKVSWALAGVVYTPRDMRDGLEIKPEWLNVIELAFKKGLNDKAIASEMKIADRTVRNYWLKIQDALGIYPEEGTNLRILTELRARSEGLLD